MKWNNDEITSNILLDQSIEQLTRLLKRAYLNASNRILNEILVLFQKIHDKNGVVLISDLYKFNRYYELMNHLNDELLDLGLKEQTYMKDALSELYIENSKLIQKQINFVTTISQEAINEAINDVWVSDGLGWSDRVWNDKDALKEELLEGLIDTISTGDDMNYLTQRLQDRFNISWNRARRLVRTELKHIEIRSAIDRYKDAGLKQYEFLTSEDEKVCQVYGIDGEPEYCKNLNHQRFPIDDTEHLPPQHPNCRCSILPVID